MVVAAVLGFIVSIVLLSSRLISCLTISVSVSIIGPSSDLVMGLLRAFRMSHTNYACPSDVL